MAGAEKKCYREAEQVMAVFTDIAGDCVRQGQGSRRRVRYPDNIGWMLQEARNSIRKFEQCARRDPNARGNWGWTLADDVRFFKKQYREVKSHAEMLLGEDRIRAGMLGGRGIHRQDSSRLRKSERGYHIPRSEFHRPTKAIDSDRTYKRGRSKRQWKVEYDF